MTKPLVLLGREMLSVWLPGLASSEDVAFAKCQAPRHATFPASPQGMCVASDWVLEHTGTPLRFVDSQDHTGTDRAPGKGFSDAYFPKGFPRDGHVSNHDTSGFGQASGSGTLNGFGSGRRLADGHTNQVYHVTDFFDGVTVEMDPDDSTLISLEYDAFVRSLSLSLMIPAEVDVNQ